MDKVEKKTFSFAELERLSLSFVMVAVSDTVEVSLASTAEAVGT